MSKRKPDDDSDNDTVSVGSIRSIRSCLALNSNASTSNTSLFNLTFTTPTATDSIYNLLKLINNFKHSHVNDDELRRQLILCTQQLVASNPPNDVRKLKYSNQLVEIPLYPRKIKLQYNTNFPFIREPMSLSVQCTHFLTNPKSYQTFKQLILKNSTLVPQLETLHVYVDQHGKTKFHLNCYIASGSQFTLSSINDTILDSANILLEHPEIWLFAFQYIHQDHQLAHEDKVRLLNEYCKNLSALFDEMKILDLLVSVKDGHVQILNILHHYFTN